MDTLSNDIQNVIYKYKHQLEFKSVMNEFSEIVDYWCDEHLILRYCKGRYQKIYFKCKENFKSLNDYEEHLCINLKSDVILDIINYTYDIFDELDYFLKSSNRRSPSYPKKVNPASKNQWKPSKKNIKKSIKNQVIKNKKVSNKSVLKHKNQNNFQKYY